MQITVSFEHVNDLKSHLKLTHKLGFSKFNVYHAQAISQNIEFAVKVFPKEESSTKTYYREKQIMSSLSHENIAQYFPIATHNLDCSILLTEYAPYGSFFELVKKNVLTNEKIIRTYFHQLVEGMEYLHSKGIAHLDLKLENLLLGKNFSLKIIDFDQSQSITDREQMFVGTVHYRAPEIRKGTCHNFMAADIYSMGVILFAIFTKEFPFNEDSDQDNENSSRNLFENDNKEFWKSKGQSQSAKNIFSEDLQKLINGMLSRDVQKRFNIKSIKESAWYKKPIFDKKTLKVEMEKALKNAY